MPLDLPLAVEHLWCMRRCLHHNVWKGPLSDKYEPPNPKGWPPACLLPCYQFAHAVGRVALAERLLSQLLSSRSEKYEFAHRGRGGGKTPTIRISGCHSALLITKLDVPASIGVHEDFPP